MKTDFDFLFGSNLILTLKSDLDLNIQLIFTLILVLSTFNIDYKKLILPIDFTFDFKILLIFDLDYDLES